MIRIDVKPDIRNRCYRNESPLPSSAISIIASYIDERVLKEISILCPWDSLLIDFLQENSLPEPATDYARLPLSAGPKR